MKKNCKCVACRHCRKYHTTVCRICGCPGFL